jgi:hypothetical protein
MANENEENNGEQQAQAMNWEDVIARLQRQMEFLQNQVQAGHVDRVDDRNQIQQLQAWARWAHEAPPPGGEAAPRVAAAEYRANPGWKPPIPRMPQLTFRNELNEDWLMFRGAFENYARYNEYDDLQGKRALLHCMKDKALLTAMQLKHEDCTTTMEQMIEMYQEKFLPPAASDRARSLFDNARAGPREEPLSWSNRLHVLHHRAYPNKEAETDEQLIRKYARGFPQRRLKDHIQRMEALTYSDALKYALKEWALMEDHEYVGGPYVEKGRVGRGEPMEVGSLQPRCAYCNLYGHYESSCKKKSQSATARSATVKPAAGIKPMLKLMHPNGGAVSHGAGAPRKFLSPRKNGFDKKPPFRGQFKRTFMAQINDFIDNLDEDSLEADEEEGQEEQQGDEEPADEGDDVRDEDEDDGQDF